jgi:Acyl-coenzyme A synthetases/AMP-(fatty) acid ligases
MSVPSPPSSDTFPFGQEVVWTPDPDVVAEANLTRFMDRHDLSGLSALQARSTTDLEWFWNAVLEDLDLEFYRDYDEVIDLSDGLAFPSWCRNGRMNIVHNLLDKWQGTPVEEQEALRWEGENGATETLTYGELHRRVGRCANALRARGLGKGTGLAFTCR